MRPLDGVATFGLAKLVGFRPVFTNGDVGEYIASIDLAESLDFLSFSDDDYTSSPNELGAIFDLFFERAKESFSWYEI
jgi:hypothetical protein